MDSVRGEKIEILLAVVVLIEEESINSLGALAKRIGVVRVLRMVLVAAEIPQELSVRAGWYERRRTSVLVLSDIVPFVSILGLQYRVVTRNSEVVLGARAYLSNCFSTSVLGLTYEWTASVAGAKDIAIRSISNNFIVFRLPPQSSSQD